MAIVHGVIHDLISDLNITAADIRTQSLLALGDYDPPTRTELTTDKDSIIAEIDANEVKIDNIQTAVGSISSIANKTAATAEDLNQAAGTYDLFTCTTDDIILESLVFRNASVDCSDDSGDFTGISIQADDSTVPIIIPQASGLKAVLTAEAQVGWIGPLLIKVGTKIQLTIYGGASDTTCLADIVVKYVSVGTGDGDLTPP